MGVYFTLSLTILFTIGHVKYLGFEGGTPISTFVYLRNKVRIGFYRVLIFYD